MILVGYSDRRQAFKVMNSWGTEWGDGGFAWISYRAISKLSYQFFVIDAAAPGLLPKPVPVVQPTPPSVIAPSPPLRVIKPEPVPQPAPVVVTPLPPMPQSPPLVVHRRRHRPRLQP